jgi:hypothetical protein
LPASPETDDGSIGDLEGELVFILGLDVRGKGIAGVIAGDDRRERRPADTQLRRSRR